MNDEIIKKIGEIAKQQAELSGVITKNYTSESYIALEKAIKKAKALYSSDFMNEIVTINQINAFNKSSDLTRIIENYTKSINQMNKTILKNQNFEYLNNYFTQLGKIYNLKSKIPSLNSMEHLTIVNRLANNTINNISLFIEDKSKDYSIKEYEDLKPIETTFPQYIGHAYRKESNVSVEEAYDKSIFNKLEEKCNEIFQQIRTINELSKNFFEDEIALMELAYNIKDVVETENGFSSIIHCVFKAIYEGSSASNNRIYKLAKDMKNEQIKSVLDLIKHLRAYYAHSSKDTDKKHIFERRDFFKEIIGKEYATKPKEWVQVQVGLYDKISKMLEEIIKLLS